MPSPTSSDPNDADVGGGKGQTDPVLAGVAPSAADVSSEGKRFVEFGCTNESCGLVGGVILVRGDTVVPKECKSCGWPLEQKQAWVPASEVERLREALAEIADDHGLTWTGGWKRERARAALADDEKEEDG